nr:ATP-binding cassette domain-containing protein [Shinella sp. XGS7]
MAGLLFRGVAKSYGEGRAPVVRALDLEVRDGEFMVLVGPSGCGKSTSLRMLAGLEPVSAGQIFIGGREVTTLPPAERGLAMVFQSYALYPHMSVAKNMGFALRMAGRPRAEVEAAVHKAARSLQLESLLTRKAHELSGGQRQRVAIGRAIVREPSAFLFDEPLSNLDAALRGTMRLEISELHHQLKTTMIYVTHDQVEAMTMADRIAVFNEGRIEQVGAPLEVYERPINRFVAGFLGSPRINMLPPQALPGAQVPAGAETLGLRPEHLRLLPPEAGRPQGEIVLIEYLGDACIAHIKIADVAQPLAVKLEAGAPWQRHQRAGLGWDPQRLLAFDGLGRRL